MFSFKQSEIKRRRKRRRTSLIWFAAKHLIIKISKYCFYLFVLSVIAFFILLKFNKNFKDNLLNHSISRKVEQILKRSCYNLKIEGVVNSDVGKINFYIGEYCSVDAKSDYTLDSLRDNIIQDPWIKIVNIRKELPYSLKVDLTEYNPFAIWKNKNEFHLINEEGEIIKISEKEQKRFYNLLIVTGKNSKDNIKTLFNLLLSNPELTSRIRIADRISDRRWNLELDSKVTVKFPEDPFIMDSWKRLEKLLSNQGIEIGLKTIDLRIDDKVFLEYEKKVFKEIKNL